MLLDSLSFICVLVVRQPFDPFHPCRSAAFPSFVSLPLGSLAFLCIVVARQPFVHLYRCRSAAF